MSGQASFDADGRLRSAEELDPTQVGGETIRAALRERAPGGLRFVLEVLPVLPAGLRPLETLEDGRRVTGDVNDLYRRVVNRNNRLRRLIELNAPRIILHNEFRMLQGTVARLFDNARTSKPLEFQGRLLESLGDRIEAGLTELGRRGAVAASGWFGAALSGPDKLPRVAAAVASGAVQLVDAPLCSPPLTSTASIASSSDSQDFGGDDDEDDYDF